ncbi:RDD family protein [Ruegeria profundi]|uniref:RDD family protein n=1 Tax=Ruegeria profundi TaxID=1685378 RepID=UPI003C7A69F3
MTQPKLDRLLPPEGVPLYFRVAGVGVRMAAQFADILITGVGAIALFLLLLAIDVVPPEALVAVAAMLFFVIRIPYYAASELVWNGQTIGKRMMKIKVVSADGQALTTQSLVVRNLMKEAEIFLPGTLVLTLNAEALIPSLISLAWVLGVVAVPVFNKRSQRLGDIIAGTYVIHLPKPILLPDMSKAIKPATATQPRFQFLTHQLEHYGAFELQTLEGFLRGAARSTGPEAHKRKKETMAAIVEQVRRKIGYADAVRPEDQLAFLEAFYKAQRAFLEQRQLFGDKRADKFHAEADKQG